MKKFIAKTLAAVAVLAAGAASVGCVWFILDEPRAHKSMID